MFRFSCAVIPIMRDEHDRKRFHDHLREVGIHPHFLSMNDELLLAQVYGNVMDTELSAECVWNEKNKAYEHYRMLYPFSDYPLQDDLDDARNEYYRIQAVIRVRLRETLHAIQQGNTTIIKRLVTSTGFYTPSLEDESITYHSGTDDDHLASDSDTNPDNTGDTNPDNTGHDSQNHYHHQYAGNTGHDRTPDSEDSIVIMNGNGMVNTSGVPTHDDRKPRVITGIMSEVNIIEPVFADNRVSTTGTSHGEPLRKAVQSGNTPDNPSSNKTGMNQGTHGDTVTSLLPASARPVPGFMPPSFPVTNPERTHGRKKNTMHENGNVTGNNTSINAVNHNGNELPVHDTKTGNSWNVTAHSDRLNNHSPEDSDNASGTHSEGSTVLLDVHGHAVENHNDNLNETAHSVTDNSTSTVQPSSIVNRKKKLFARDKSEAVTDELEEQPAMMYQFEVDDE